MTENQGQALRLLLTIPDAAASISVGRTTLYELIARGEIETVTIGRRRLVPSSALEAYVAKLTGTAA